MNNIADILCPYWVYHRGMFGSFFSISNFHFIVISFNNENNIKSLAKYYKYVVIWENHIEMSNKKKL